MVESTSNESTSIKHDQKIKLLFGFSFLFISFIIIGVIIDPLLPSYIGIWPLSGVAAVASAFSALGTLALAYVTYTTLEQNSNLIELQRQQVEELKKDRELTEKKVKQDQKGVIIKLISDGLHKIKYNLNKLEETLSNYSSQSEPIPMLHYSSVDNHLLADLENKDPELINKYRELENTLDNYSQKRREVSSMLEKYISSEFDPERFEERMSRLAEENERIDPQLDRNFTENSTFLARCILIGDSTSNSTGYQARLYREFEQEVDSIRQEPEFASKITDLVELRNQIKSSVNELIQYPEPTIQLYLDEYPITMTEVEEYKNNQSDVRFQ